MKIFNVHVNGKAYLVDIEEITGTVVNPSIPVPAPGYAPLPNSAAQASKANTPVKPASASVDCELSSAGAIVITCPIPGTILKIEKAVGASVKAGELLIILEAMKMENEIIAPGDGVISQIPVSVGASVDTGDVLIVM